MQIIITESQMKALSEKLWANIIGKKDGAEIDWDSPKDISKKREVDLKISDLIYNQPKSDEKDPGYQKIVKGLMKKYETKDYIDPLFVYEYKGKYKILDGHHRVSALKKLGREKVNCIVVPKKNIKHKKDFSDDAKIKTKSNHKNGK